MSNKDKITETRYTTLLDKIGSILKKVENPLITQ